MAQRSQSSRVPETWEREVFSDGWRSARRILRENRGQVF